jgi:hypothetical protein
MGNVANISEAHAVSIFRWGEDEYVLIQFLVEQTSGVEGGWC